MNIGVLGSGAGTNFEAIVDAINAGQLEASIAVVISDYAHAPILEKAGRHHLPAVFIPPGKFKTFLEPSVEDQYIQCLRDHHVEWIALAGFMRVLKDAFFKAYGGRIMNIHPSLLPSFKGLEAWRQALDFGVKITGCTVHLVDQGVDTGLIILQEAVSVHDEDTYETLHRRIQDAEHRLYPQALQWISENKIEIKDRKVLIRKEIV